LATSFNEQFDQHGAWRRELALRLKLLAEWMREHQLMDAAVSERLHRLEVQMRSDKVMVAFVAEVSRGKSELINAIFFAGYGRRIMPASAGRTTMCPTELGYEAGTPPCLRLLPIETRLQPKALTEWRAESQHWERVDLNMHDAAQLAGALEKVAEVRRVTQDEARALGFWHDQVPEDNPTVDAKGMVEVPRWRHALINIAHPLLKQGLVILDTPGLNAIGAEPELTVSLIPQAHAVVFMLAADTGVTKSDLTIWREHLVAEDANSDARLVVLNKIDTLWDALSTPAQVQAQIDKQVASTAETLGVPASQVLPVSAQKGLVAKVTQDAALLQVSRLPVLEEALGKGIMGRRQSILRSTVANGIADLRTETGRVINIRRRDLAEQMLELRGLRGKNASVIGTMRERISEEQREFDQSGAKVMAVRSVHVKMMRDLLHSLGTNAVNAQVQPLITSLRQKGLKIGVKKAYADTFSRLMDSVQRAQTASQEIQTMLGASFRQLNAEYSFSLQPPPEPEFARYQADLQLIERSHLQYLGLGNALKLAQPEFAERLVRALTTRLRVVFESIQSDLELWSKSTTAQLDSQLRERRKSFMRRIEAIDRIQQAATGLNDRIAEIEASDALLGQLDTKLRELTSYLVREQVTEPGLLERKAA
jgi:Dynamin family